MSHPSLSHKVRTSAKARIADEPEFDAYDPSGRAASAQHAPISQKEVWETIDAHFRDRGLVKQNIESFNEFCENTLQQAVADGDPIILEQTVQNTGAEEDAIVRHKLVFGQVYLQAPRTRGEYANATPALMPQNARLRDMTYAGKLLVDIDEYKKDDQDEDYVFVRTLEAIPLGRVRYTLWSLLETSLICVLDTHHVAVKLLPFAGYPVRASA